MLDFVKIQKIETKKSVIIFPEFVVIKSKDLMIRGKSFYAIWDEEIGLWSTSEMDVQRMVDQMIFDYAKEEGLTGIAQLKLLRDFASNKWNEWQKYCKSLPDNYHELDVKVIFANTEVKKTDYASKVLPYALIDSPIPAYDELMSTLYDEVEREKIEWGIGSIIAGESKNIQKFFVFYGAPGTGKSTVLNLISDLFGEYCGIFDAKSVSSSSNSFALDAFRNNPLLAIQHDGDLSRIEDNTKINSIVSHEKMTINEKFKSPYSMKIKTMLFMGTNKPVRITDAKSGLLRRLIDISPTGEKFSLEKYSQLIEQIKFELGGIAYRCLSVYKELGKGYYNTYSPSSMLEITNDFYIFIEDNYDLFAYAEDDMITLSTAWLRYKDYCEKANIKYPMNMRAFKTELMAYYQIFYPRHEGKYSVYSGFLKEKIGSMNENTKKTRGDILEENWLKFEKKNESEFDICFKSYQAQYGNAEEVPSMKWENVTTCLVDLDTSKLHYICLPVNHIVIDFDLKDESGKKSFKKNLEEASKWPQTYAELSKSGEGIHLHYWYDGDPTELSRIYKEDIEVKVFTGKSSLRRKLTKCNDIPIAHISGGLPIKERSRRMVTDTTVKSELRLRELIKKNLKKEIHPATKPSMDFIYKILSDAYESGLKYDVKDMRPAIQNFAMNSTHQADYCLRLLSKMKFESEEPSENVEEYQNDDLIFYDVEIFPNLFLICWKKQGEGKDVVQMFNPTPEEVKELVSHRLVGFNNRRYDNHLLYAKMMGYSVEQLYLLSQRIIAGESGCFFGEAYNLSYTDIYDFLSPSHKMSLKKWEIELGIHHQELGLPWDKPVPEELWKKVGEYCNYDVLATEAAFNANQSDWATRKILADLAGMTVNDTTNSLAQRIIFGRDRNPQDQFIYTNLSEEFPGYEFNKFGIDPKRYNEGVKIVSGKSIYRGEDPSEGGYVYAEPGIYTNVVVLDIGSMHPTTIIELNLFGDVYTKRFQELKDSRILIKHKQYEEAGKMLDGKLAKYLEDEKTAEGLPLALKGVINPVYGLTSAKFPNAFKDPRNEDNIVAKRGALFMIDLKHEVQDRGYPVIHIKTDSIKIANADESIIRFVMEYGKKFGYTFEHETTYDRICLVNDSTYIAKVSGGENGEKLENPYWTATGTQFQVPYVFKTLFSKESIEFEDLCETKSVSTALYLDMNEDDEGLPFDKEGNPTPDNHPCHHDYRFVGKVGLFCPMKDGAGGGILLREISEAQQEKTGKRFSAANGSNNGGKMYRWMESEMVKDLGLQDQIDRSYYDVFVDDAIETISEYGDFEMFVSNDIYEEELPFL